MRALLPLIAGVFVLGGLLVGRADHAAAASRASAASATSPAATVCVTTGPLSVGGVPILPVIGVCVPV